MTRKFTWDGEKIKETVVSEDKKHTPKDILNALDNVTAQIVQFENAEKQLEQQKTQNELNLKSAREFKKTLAELENQCIEYQTKSMELIIRQIHDDSVIKARDKADEIIMKSPDAYTEEQKKQLPFLEYQKFLATNGKTVEKISNRMIRLLLYEKPIFENPFKD